MIIKREDRNPFMEPLGIIRAFRTSENPKLGKIVKNLKYIELLNNLQIVNFVVILVLCFKKFVHIVDVISVNAFKLSSRESHGNNIMENIWE